MFSYDQPYGDPAGHLCEMLHKLYIGRATKGENFTKTMKRERVNLKEDSHQKRGGEVGQERQEGGGKGGEGQSVMLLCT